jgi:hypothetical protein
MKLFGWVIERASVLEEKEQQVRRAERACEFSFEELSRVEGLLEEVKKERDYLKAERYRLLDEVQGLKRQAPDQPDPQVVKTLDITDISEARKAIADLKVVGNGDMWRLLSKASSETQGWMKSTKALQVRNGCLVQVTTQQRNPDGSYAIAEALTFVPVVAIQPDQNGGYRVQ